MQRSLLERLTTDDCYNTNLFQQERGLASHASCMLGNGVSPFLDLQTHVYTCMYLQAIVNRLLYSRCATQYHRTEHSSCYIMEHKQSHKILTNKSASASGTIYYVFITLCWYFHHNRVRSPHNHNHWHHLPLPREAKCVKTDPSSARLK